ncbi:hypothetical protein TNCV_2972081 [Trichonephila clavipes]|nr:hypothetical protein TNCV_2972081 [Trichonephila clavipes]
MTFLRLEVQGEEMVQLAKSGFGTPIRKRDSPTERVKPTELMTASALASSEKSAAKIIELIPGRDGEIRTVRLKTQHGTVIRPVQRIFPLEVQAIANSDKELKEESISVKSTKPEKVLNTNDAIVKKNILLLEDWLKNRSDLIF